MREQILETIRKWKHFWMNQRQNSEADFKNYFERSAGIDANMVHHLADEVYKTITTPYSFEEADKEGRARGYNERNCFINPFHNGVQYGWDLAQAKIKELEEKLK